MVFIGFRQKNLTLFFGVKAKADLLQSRTQITASVYIPFGAVNSDQDITGRKLPLVQGGDLKMKKLIAFLIATGAFLLLLACPQNVEDATAGRIIGCGLCGCVCFLLAYIMDGNAKTGFFIHGEEE